MELWGLEIFGPWILSLDIGRMYEGSEISDP